ncbi:histidine phosphatase family protein [Mangrovitalea sediminis]|uniref:histidine phosphatase family protein n=1 Tax=Mangrovitalea sediminis TaxID=1982043 RepID=UPI000BE55F0C|nr:histidine phosphatase family protein [Mangrovitalea sediminis]
MATIYLVRHGQASFGQSDYDKLSSRGWEQGRVLGRWLRSQTAPATVFSGDLRRHRETLSAIEEGLGNPLPATVIDPGFNEFDHEAVIHAHRPEWADRQVLAQELARHREPAKAFQKTFAEAMQRWLEGDRAAEYPETWPAFQARVTQALEKAIADTEGAGDILVATSGGPITVIVQALLGLDNRTALGLNEVVANASVSRVLFSGERRSLAVFNSFSHLEAESASLVTYR